MKATINCDCLPVETLLACPNERRAWHRYNTTYPIWLESTSTSCSQPLGSRMSGLHCLVCWYLLLETRNIFEDKVLVLGNMSGLISISHPRCTGFACVYIFLVVLLFPSSSAYPYQGIGGGGWTLDPILATIGREAGYTLYKSPVCYRAIHT